MIDVSDNESAQPWFFAILANPGGKEPLHGKLFATYNDYESFAAATKESLLGGLMLSPTTQNGPFDIEIVDQGTTPPPNKTLFLHIWSDRHSGEPLIVVYDSYLSMVRGIAENFVEDHNHYVDENCIDFPGEVVRLDYNGKTLHRSVQEKKWEVIASIVDEIREFATTGNEFARRTAN